MPKIGEIKQGWEIGKANSPLGKKNHQSFVWHACVDCGKERWVEIRNKGKLPYIRCVRCAAQRIERKSIGAKNHKWKGGQIKLGYYRGILLRPDDPYYTMASKGYVWEHRLIMAKHLGRCLLKSEHVHHINGIRTDNRRENLELLSRASHSIRTTLCAHCELRKELRLQKWQIKNLEEQVRNLTSTRLGIEG